MNPHPKFTNLSEAFSLHKKCRSCGHAMTACYNDRSIWPPENYDNQTIEIDIAEASDSYTKNLLNINVFNNDISLRFEPYHFSPKDTTSNNLSWRGSLHESFNIICLECYNFSFIIQVIVEINGEMISISKILLNSETINIIDNKYINHIKSIYTIGETEYTRINKLDNLNIITMYFPLIPLDVNNPQETLKRINKLAIFR